VRLGLLLAVAAGVLALAATPAAAKVTTVRATVITTSQVVVDNPPAATTAAPFSAGDLVVFVNRLVAHGKTLGAHRGTCSATDERHLICTAVSHLPGGDLMIVGDLDVTSTKPQLLAIVGGTRRYRGASGELEATLTETKESFVYRIRS
jgi:hypothetical protein